MYHVFCPLFVIDVSFDAHKKFKDIMAYIYDKIFSCMTQNIVFGKIDIF